jgi:ubiquinone/menaquinone biosynthesis C-methylase UbiE
MISMKTDNKSVCPVELAGGLDNRLRRFLQNPRKILAPYIRPKMTALDLGCGPGFFTIEMGRMLYGSGKVVAADLQQGMLDKVVAKIKGTVLENTIQLHKCQDDRIGLAEKVDFILAFFMVHEVPDHDKLFAEVKTLLKPGGRMLIIEPNFHVSKKSFNSMMEIIHKYGLTEIDRPRHFLCRSVLIGNQ